MRIIGGKLKGIRFNAPENLPVRPTTDMAKEALFNILNNTYHFEDCEVLDLFAGTGNVSIEFASRGVKGVTAVDRHTGCINWIKAISNKYDLKEISVYKADVFKFLTLQQGTYQIIFADPPYDLPAISKLPELVLNNNLLADNGIFVLEHPSYLKMNQQQGFIETRKYGNSSFSFFNQLSANETP